jgi:hypothetical protein
MTRRMIVVALAGLLPAVAGFAEPMRTQLTRENKFPGLYQPELGMTALHRDFEDGEANSLAPYVRVGVISNLTFITEAPFVFTDPDSGDKEAGLGDVRLGLELLAFQDIFDYPFIVPHLDITLATGDEDDGMGVGDTVTTAGISVGSRMYEVLTLIGDIAYSLNGGGPVGDREDVLILAGSLVWDLSEQFALLAEGKVTDENSANDHPAYLQGGLAYKPTENLMIAAYGGQWSSAGEDVNASIKVAYTF